MKTTGVSVCVTLPWLIDLYLTYVCISAVLVVGQYHKLEMKGLHWPEKTHIIGEKAGLMSNVFVYLSFLSNTLMSTQPSGSVNSTTVTC